MGLIPYKKYKTIAHNTAYLSILEVLKVVMPFLALPYIIKTVGTENYGLVAFAQAIIAYFIMLVNFGLDISAVKDVSVNRDNPGKLSEIVSAVLLIKVLLFVVALVILTGLIFSIDTFRQHIALYYFSFLTCLAEILFPGWFYQGLEKMKYITLIRFISILFYTTSIFVFIKSPDDYLYIPLLQSIGWIISGSISFYLLIKVEKITFFVPDFKLIKKYFVDSIPFFMSRISVVINTNLAKTICGFMFSMHVVGAFDLAQKIASIALVPLQMLNQAIFPHIAKTKDRIFATKGLFFVIGLATIIVISVYLLAPFAINILSSGELMSAVPILRAFCFFIFCGGITLYTGSPLLVSFGHAKPFNFSVILSTFVLAGIYLLLYFTDRFTIINFAFALGTAEFVIAILRLFYCYYYKIINVRWIL